MRSTVAAAMPARDDAPPAPRRQPGGGHADHDRVVAGEHDVDDDHRDERARLVQALPARSRHKHEAGRRRGQADDDIGAAATPRADRPRGSARSTRRAFSSSASSCRSGRYGWPAAASMRRQIAIVFAAAIWAKVIATPALGALADRLGRRRAVMIALAALRLRGLCRAVAGRRVLAAPGAQPRRRRRRNRR